METTIISCNECVGRYHANEENTKMVFDKNDFRIETTCPSCVKKTSAKVATDIEKK